MGVDVVPLFYNRISLSGRVKTPIRLSLDDTPMILISGATGSGKTYAIRYLLAKIVKHLPEIKITIIDFKQYDFVDFSDTSRYYGYDNAFDGLVDFDSEFKARQSEKASPGCKYSRIVLLFDEWSAFLAGLDKKKADEAKAILQRILSLGRIYSVNVICGMQRADSSNFSVGSRDNFGVVILMGQGSQEQNRMLLSDYTDQLLPCGRGQGHMVIAGQGLKHIVVPSYDRKKADEYIRKAMV